MLRRWLPAAVVLAVALAGCVIVPERQHALVLETDGTVAQRQISCGDRAEASAATAGALDPRTVRIASWNVHKQSDPGWEAELGRLIAANDVLLLQEAGVARELRRPRREPAAGPPRSSRPRAASRRRSSRADKSNVVSPTGIDVRSLSCGPPRPIPSSPTSNDQAKLSLGHNTSSWTIFCSSIRRVPKKPLIILEGRRACSQVPLAPVALITAHCVRAPEFAPPPRSSNTVCVGKLDPHLRFHSNFVFQESLTQCDRRSGQ